MLKSLCISSASLAIFLSLSTPALAESSGTVPQVEVKQSAPTEVKPEELEKFAAAMQEMRAIQLESRDEISAAIDEEGLSKDRFRAILQAQRNPEVETDASEEELQKFESATEQLAQIQKDTQSEMREAVEAQGLDVTRFQQILGIVREDPELQKQVQQMIQSGNN
ncbi:MAG: DUF4168 domain-containing protein [Cyanobacteria bacterium]|jgi:hypothetical protein|nr:DUF4168 domain-containing protein [Cyanobacteria bacterium GSL.Bin21]